MDNKKYGVVDIGSNTIRFNIYRDNSKSYKVISSKKTFAGLSSYVDDEGNLDPQGIKKIKKNINKFQDIAEEFGVDEMYIFATASVRNVNNAAQILKTIKAETGVTIDLLSGEAEGEAGFYGVKLSTELDRGYILDIGGGSTEIISFKDGAYSSSISLPIGSLSSYKTFVTGIVPTKEEVQQIRAYIRGALLIEDRRIAKITDAKLYGIGGTIRATGNIGEEYTAHTDRCTDRATVEELITGLVNQDKDLIRCTLKVTPERIHTQVPGMVLLSECMNYLGMDTIEISKNGVREGYLYLQKGGK
ncbi:hypothetical protein O6R05_07490 [Peptoniphilus equinus]|uniref:Ppx/GppA phosphatase N-terminal domain-containing protein n=1 Tax=Peptoniphilus equinus TaxID=3016343 RepID=A0ABY7QSQ5_9FIRM|nr:hypothetical protein [Peptoniphilus equinus]WBW49836.1 hypothetical protein O6R05_07490 [Peptoniphilus equinus]